MVISNSSRRLYLSCRKARAPTSVSLAPLASKASPPSSDSSRSPNRNPTRLSSSPQLAGPPAVSPISLARCMAAMSWGSRARRKSRAGSTTNSASMPRSICKHHRSERALKTATPNGVDINSESVGGEIMENRMNVRDRVVRCGLIPGYTKADPALSSVGRVPMKGLSVRPRFRTFMFAFLFGLIVASR
jgi:hypothetical protein